MEHINWYPGHMKKTRELIAENLKMVDAVVEVVDARIPVSSRNPIIDELTAGKERVIALNKSDLSDPAENAAWTEYFIQRGLACVLLNANTGSGIPQLYKALEGIQDRKNRERLRPKVLRMMVVGVPNAGKSSLINRMTGRRAAQVGDRPGVTKGKQWITLKNGMQLLDTPGILWPKFEDPRCGLDLAFCGSIRDEILDMSELCLELLKTLWADYPQLVADRYKLSAAEKAGETADGTDDGMEADAGAQAPEEAGQILALMEQIASKRGLILPGKRIDYERCARMVLDEFRSGMIGRITLEKAGRQK